MRTAYSFSLALLFAFSIWRSDPTAAQAVEKGAMLSGRVTVSDRNVPARETLIWIVEAKRHTQFTVQQDSNGAFTIMLPEGYYFVFVANLGLKPYAKEVMIERGKQQNLIVHLEPDFEIMQDTQATKPSP